MGPGANTMHTAAAKVGSFWNFPVVLGEGERVLRSESAQVSPWYLIGRLYLTDRRLIWSPFVVYRPFPVRPVLISLKELAQVSYGKRVLTSIVSQPVQVKAGDEVYKFCIGARYTKAAAAVWLQAIELAASVAPAND